MMMNIDNNIGILDVRNIIRIVNKECPQILGNFERKKNCDKSYLSGLMFILLLI